MSKKRPCGYYPFDKSWGVATSSMGDNLSPFPRINRYRDWLLAPENEFDIDARRAELVTEAYRMYDVYPQEIKMAKVVRHVLENYEIAIRPEELIVGEMAAPPKAVPLFPEFSYPWICDELRNWPLHEREIGAYRPTNPETVRRALELEEYWKGKSIEDKYMATIPEEERRCMAAGIFFLSLAVRGGIGHLVVDYERVIRVGLKSLKTRVEEELSRVDSTTPKGVQARIFYQAELIALDGMSLYIKRYSDLAREMAKSEADAGRKKELEKIGDVCEWISENGARTFYEALQLQQFITLFVMIESNGHSISYGRFDQYMNPYYEHDMATGEATKDEIMELLEYFYLKSYTFGKLRDRITVRHASDGRGMGGECLTVGGVDIQGHDVTNDMTLMCLDAYMDTRMKTPWPLVRLHSRTPHELMVKTANAILAGTGQPKIYNDEVAIPTMMAKGATLEDARNYDVVGCVELNVPGKEYGHQDAAYYNISRLLELAINDGKWMETGEQFGPRTGCLQDMKSFDEVLEAYNRQLTYFTDRLVCCLETVELMHQTYKPLPYLSCFVQDCIGRGVDVSAGGAVYNHTGPQGCGLGTMADSLSTIKQLVFDEKKVTADELMAALKADWKGYQPLLQLVNSNKVHHYGNDDDYADDLAQWVFNLYCEKVEGRPNGRGGTYCPGVYTVAVNVGAGIIQWATPDGRVAHEPISDCVGAVHTHVASHDINGPMAMLRSVSKLNHSRATNGTLLNWMFDPGSVSGEAGRDNFIAFLKEIVTSKVMHSQFNVVDRKTLEDAKAHPEKYRSLLVRVAGYSALFVVLGPVLQQDIIERTSYSFD